MGVVSRRGQNNIWEMGNHNGRTTLPLQEEGKGATKAMIVGSETAPNYGSTNGINSPRKPKRPQGIEVFFM